MAPYTKLAKKVGRDGGSHESRRKDRALPLHEITEDVP